MLSEPVTCTLYVYICETIFNINISFYTQHTFFLWVFVVSLILQLLPELISTLLDAGAILDTRDDRGWTPLHIATRYNSVSFVQLMLKYSSSPTILLACDTNGLSPIITSILLVYSSSAINFSHQIPRRTYCFVPVGFSRTPCHLFR